MSVSSFPELQCLDYTELESLEDLLTASQCDIQHLEKQSDEAAESDDESSNVVRVCESFVDRLTRMSQCCLPSALSSCCTPQAVVECEVVRVAQLLREEPNLPLDADGNIADVTSTVLWPKQHCAFAKDGERCRWHAAKRV